MDYSVSERISMISESGKCLSGNRKRIFFLQEENEIINNDTNEINDNTLFIVLIFNMLLWLYYVINNQFQLLCFSSQIKISVFFIA